LIRGAILTKYGLEIRFFYSLNANIMGARLFARPASFAGDH